VRLIILSVAVALILASCSSNPAAPGGSPLVKSKPASGAIPVEKRALVKFADGSLDEYTVSEYDPSDITLLSSQNRFSASGGLMDQIEFTYQEDKKVLTAKMTKDEENRLKSRIVYERDENTDQLIKETVVNKAGKAVSSNSYTYDDSGNIASRAILNGAGTPLAVTQYTYNGKLVVSSKTTDPRNNNVISSSENEYDRDGHLVNQTLKNKDGKVTRKIATVWKDGKEVENTQTAADGKVQLKITNEYGSAGELVKKTVENYQGNSVQVMEFEYEFRPDRGRT
jgi:hypothetical protein